MAWYINGSFFACAVDFVESDYGGQTRPTTHLSTNDKLYHGVHMKHMCVCVCVCVQAKTEVYLLQVLREGPAAAAARAAGNALKSRAFDLNQILFCCKY